VGCDSALTAGALDWVEPKLASQFPGAGAVFKALAHNRTIKLRCFGLRALEIRPLASAGRTRRSAWIRRSENSLSGI
jgi:hypothetical protein